VTITYSPIGHCITPHKELTGMPIQPVGARGVKGCIQVLPQYAEGLKDLEGFSHVFVLYHLHRVEGYDLMVKPFLDNDLHGIFATRSPRRPNPMGLSVLRITGVHGNLVRVEDVDMLDGTPVIDIKPFVADFDLRGADRFGWFEGRSDNATTMRSDDRFVGPGAAPSPNGAARPEGPTLAAHPAPPEPTAPGAPGRAAARKARKATESADA
jgi:tRNA-Thr(GGU) m(6)t(6)A37 methyltransferase TsaA